MKFPSIPALTLISAIGSLAAPEIPRTFSTSGFGKVFYEPDSYDLTFGVVTEDPDLQTCKEKHVGIVKSVENYLESVKTNIEMQKQESTKLDTIYKSGTLENVFRFTSLYLVRVKDPKNLIGFQESLISAGVTDITKLDVFSKRLQEYNDLARREAIKDAKRKAELAAEELGWKILGAISMTYERPFGNFDPFAINNSSVNYGSRAPAYSENARPDFTTYTTEAVNIVFSIAWEHPPAGQDSSDDNDSSSE